MTFKRPFQKEESEKLKSTHRTTWKEGFLIKLQILRPPPYPQRVRIPGHVAYPVFMKVGPKTHCSHIDSGCLEKKALTPSEERNPRKHGERETKPLMAKMTSNTLSKTRGKRNRNAPETGPSLHQAVPAPFHRDQEPPQDLCLRYFPLQQAPALHKAFLSGLPSQEMSDVAFSACFMSPSEGGQ